MAKKKEKKIYVLDISVIRYDHNALMQFGEHRVALPVVVLEQLDKLQEGNDTVNSSVRKFTAMIDKLSENKDDLSGWMDLGNNKGGTFTIAANGVDKVVKQDAYKIFGEKKSTHTILNIASWLAENNDDYKVILVSKNVNLRVKAKSLGLAAQDYHHGKIDNADQIYKGVTTVENVNPGVIDGLYASQVSSVKEIGLDGKPTANHYYILKNGSKSILTHYSKQDDQLHRFEKESCYGIRPLNLEQACALHAILDPNVKLVTLQGVAGTGKTLLALAGAIAKKKDYFQIYLARPIVPLSNKDIGFLPGDIKSKINPYMEPLWDNLKFIQSQFPEKGKEAKQIQQMVEQEKLLITPLAYIRGRSLSKIFFIIDEAQNLTPHEVKTIITRAGKDTKIVFTGDIFQIDTPYLDAESNGLSHLIESTKGHPLCAHVTLEQGERSELANLANELL